MSVKQYNMLVPKSGLLLGSRNMLVFKSGLLLGSRNMLVPKSGLLLGSLFFGSKVNMFLSR